jgi:hypothetical protein
VTKKKAGKAASGNVPNPTTVPETTADTVGQFAEYIGASLADLMNRKDVLARQLADVEQQISSARSVVTARVAKVADALPSLASLAGRKAATAKKARATGAKKGNRKQKRALPPDEPMVTATSRARAADAKGRAAQRARTSRRSGNR